MTSNRVCAQCGVPLALARTGRPKLFCGATCRKAAQRSRPVQLELPTGESSDDPRDFLEVIGRYRVAGAATLPDEHLRALHALSVNASPAVWCLGDRVAVTVVLGRRSRASRG